MPLPLIFLRGTTMEINEDNIKKRRRGTPTFPLSLRNMTMFRHITEITKSERGTDSYVSRSPFPWIILLPRGKTN